jgi:HEAT repeat protein
MVTFSGLGVSRCVAEDAPTDPVAKAWKILDDGLADKGDTKANALHALGIMNKNPKADELATAALKDPDPDVRAAAADALGQMGATSAIPTMQELVKAEEDASVVLSIGRALVTLHDPLGYAVYYAVLTGERKSGASLMEEQKKMLHDPKKMAQFGFEQGIGFVPFAGIGWGAFKMITKDDVSPIRAAAAKTLAQDPDPKSNEALVNATTDKSWLVRAAAANALALRGDPADIPNLAPVLDDDKEVVRNTAAAAILHLHDIATGKVKHPKKGKIAEAY